MIYKFTNILSQLHNETMARNSRTYSEHSDYNLGHCMFAKIRRINDSTILLPMFVDSYSYTLRKNEFRNVTAYVPIKLPSYRNVPEVTTVNMLLKKILNHTILSIGNRSTSELAVYRFKNNVYYGNSRLILDGNYNVLLAIFGSFDMYYHSDRKYMVFINSSFYNNPEFKSTIRNEVIPALLDNKKPVEIKIDSDDSSLFYRCDTSHIVLNSTKINNRLAQYNYKKVDIGLIYQSLDV